MVVCAAWTGGFTRRPAGRRRRYLKYRFAARSFAAALVVTILSTGLIAQQGAGPSRAQLQSVQSASGPGFAAILQSSQQTGGTSLPSLMNQVQVQGPYRGSVPQKGEEARGC